MVIPEYIEANMLKEIGFQVESEIRKVRQHVGIEAIIGFA